MATQKMNAKVKQAWLDALRSGEYKQGRQRLHVKEDSSHKYCCLGVLCDLFIQEHPGEQWKVSDIFKLSKRTVYEFRCTGDLLPKEVWKWAGLPDMNPYVDIGTGSTLSLSQVNDNGVRFKRIADMIERSL